MTTIYCDIYLVHFFNTLFLVFPKEVQYYEAIRFFKRRNVDKGDIYVLMLVVF